MEISLFHGKINRKETGEDIHEKAAKAYFKPDCDFWPGLMCPACLVHDFCNQAKSVFCVDFRLFDGAEYSGDSVDHQQG